MFNRKECDVFAVSSTEKKCIDMLWQFQTNPTWRKLRGPRASCAERKVCTALRVTEVSVVFAVRVWEAMQENPVRQGPLYVQCMRVRAVGIPEVAMRVDKLFDDLM